MLKLTQKFMTVPFGLITRCAATSWMVAKDESLDSVKERLLEFHKEILEPEFQQRLKKKFDKTKGFYPGKDLCLSITFRNGDLRYSFHPRDLVEYKVRFIVSMGTNTLLNADTIPAY